MTIRPSQTSPDDWAADFIVPQIPDPTPNRLAQAQITARWQRLRALGCRCDQHHHAHCSHAQHGDQRACCQCDCVLIQPPLANTKAAPRLKIVETGSLFQEGAFQLNSGQQTDFKIECDALTNGDIRVLARRLNQRLPRFTVVEGVPTGGLRIAEALRVYAAPNSSEDPARDTLLIVDDVFTTGGSMQRHRAGRPAIGAVLFARGPCPPWIIPLFVETPPTPALHAENLQWEGVDPIFRSLVSETRTDSSTRTDPLRTP